MQVLRRCSCYVEKLAHIFNHMGNFNAIQRDGYTGFAKLSSMSPSSGRTHNNVELKQDQGCHLKCYEV